MLTTLSLTNNGIGRPHIWLHNRTSGGALRPVSQVCTAPTDDPKFS